MPIPVKALSPLAISKLAHSDPASNRPELVAVGHVPGLCLQIGLPDANGVSSKSWIYRVQIGTRRRWAGLGGYPATSLAMAIETARQMRADVRAGRDPIEARQTARAALLASQARDVTITQAVERFLPLRLAKIGTERARHRWQSTVAQYVLPVIGSMHVADVTKADVLRVLRQPHTVSRSGVTGELYKVIPETAYALRGRIEEVLAWCISERLREPPNPAEWSGNIEHDLPSKGDVRADVSHPAIAVSDAPAWFAALRERGGHGARALEFLALTAVRSANVREATWQQINHDAGLWIIAAADMKESDNGEHVVPLAPYARHLLDGMRAHRNNRSNLIFPSARDTPLSDMALSMLMRKMHAAKHDADGIGWIDTTSKRPCVPHGLRATFSTWANDHAEYEPDMIEFALAHRVGSEVSQRYRRGSMVQKRRELMADWATHLNSLALRST